jgi:hypothetical protein
MIPPHGSESRTWPEEPPTPTQGDQRAGEALDDRGGAILDGAYLLSNVTRPGQAAVSLVVDRGLADEAMPGAGELAAARLRPVRTMTFG